MTMRRAITLVLIGLLLVVRAAAQGDEPSSHARQVFLTSDNQLTFIDLMTGDAYSVGVNGDHFTVLPDAVMFFDRASHRVMVAAPDGTLSQHPFIRTSEAVARVDWALSHDEQNIAWTETSGAPTALTTVTWVSEIDGTNAKPVFNDGPRDGIRAYPVAFSPDKSVLYMDYQPNTIGDLTPFRQYAGLFALNLASGETTALPGEPGCFCGADIGADFFLRLTLADSGFNLRIRNLRNESETTLAPVNSFTQGGDVLIAPDGKRAAYALAQISNFGTAQQSVQTVIVLVDLLTLTQSPLGAPVNRLLRPIQWTEDDSAILFVDAQAQTTWKATVRDGAFEQVANGRYLGTLIVG
ncbi:MAG: hypothetical protein IT319_16330 [Anaerolineae bacterium]|nr:hypothetical protein [Anaerolineae bacterium]